MTEHEGSFGEIKGCGEEDYLYHQVELDDPSLLFDEGCSINKNRTRNFGQLKNFFHVSISSIAFLSRLTYSLVTRLFEGLFGLPSGGCLGRLVFDNIIVINRYYYRLIVDKLLPHRKIPNPSTFSLISPYYKYIKLRAVSHARIYGIG